MATYAEDLPYWKTSDVLGVDDWMDKIKQEIRNAEGKVTQEGFVSDNDKQSFLVGFCVGGDTFQIYWPVIRPKTVNDKNMKAAKLQAITMLHHDIKARCVSARVLGIRSSFMGYLLLENGQTASQMSNADYMMLIPKSLMLGSGQ